MNEILATAVVVYVIVTTAQYFVIKRLWFNHCQAIIPEIAKHSVVEDRQQAKSFAFQMMWVPIIGVIGVLPVTGFKFKTKEY